MFNYSWAIGAVQVGGVLASIVGAYYGSQTAIRIAVVRLEVRFADIERRVQAQEGQEVGVIRSQLADARKEIEGLRDKKHEIGGLKAKIELLIDLFARAMRLERELPRELPR